MNWGIYAIIRDILAAGKTAPKISVLLTAGKTAPAKVLGLAWRLIPRLGLWGRMVPSADMADQGSLDRDLYAPVAQLVEHRLSLGGVQGSSPCGGTTPKGAFHLFSLL